MNLLLLLPDEVSADGTARLGGERLRHLREVLGPGERWLLHPGDDGPRQPGQGRLALAIGPEGGWVPFERTLLEAQGFRTLGFGARTLRTETVVPFALGWATGRR